jgi:hypothetical protein
MRILSSVDVWAPPAYRPKRDTRTRRTYGQIGAAHTRGTWLSQMAFCRRTAAPVQWAQGKRERTNEGMKPKERRRLLRGRVGQTLWLASLILAVALITATVGGTGARAARGLHTQHMAQVHRSQRAGLSGVHGKLVLRSAGAPMSPE